MLHNHSHVLINIRGIHMCVYLVAWERAQVKSQILHQNLLAKETDVHIQIFSNVCTKPTHVHVAAICSSFLRTHSYLPLCFAKVALCGNGGSAGCERFNGETKPFCGERLEGDSVEFFFQCSK